MSENEANKIIAEYMDNTDEGVTCESCGDINSYVEYSESLDALVPVWEKLKIREGFLLFADISQVLVGSDSSVGETIQQAAAIATAKAIQEIINNTEKEG